MERGMNEGTQHGIHRTGQHEKNHHMHRSPGRRRSGLAWAALTVVTLVGALGAGPVQSQTQPPLRQQFIVLASTTSTEQSGLFGHLLPAFSAATGITVRVVALGTGQALDTARRGDADVLLVHDPAAEERFMAEGFGLSRQAVMTNHFVLVGPRADPAGVKGLALVAAFKRLAAQPAPLVQFVSRGDRSGTHAAELRLWEAAGLAAPPKQRPGFKDCGCAMGPALNMASSLGAYLLTDRSTWLAFRNRGELLELLHEQARLPNPYSVIVVDPARHPHTKTALAQRFADWLVSAPGQARIAGHQVGGEQLFFPGQATR